MQKFDMKVKELTEKMIKIAPQEKQKKVDQKRELMVEGDASALSYWALYSLLMKKTITIENLGTSTQQGDYQFITLLENFGLKVIANENTTIMSSEGLVQPIEEPSHYDFSDMPDVSMTFFILALFLPGNTHITGLHTLNKKECRRIESMGAEIRKLGVTAEWTEESITIGTFDKEAWENHETINIETYDDHRIAMCFGILGECIGKLNILNPTCVAKTYPEFWDDLISLK